MESCVLIGHYSIHMWHSLNVMGSNNSIKIGCEVCLVLAIANYELWSWITKHGSYNKHHRIKVSQDGLLSKEIF